MPTPAKVINRDNQLSKSITPSKAFIGGRTSPNAPIIRKISQPQQNFAPPPREGEDMYGGLNDILPTVS